MNINDVEIRNDGTVTGPGISALITPGEGCYVSQGALAVVKAALIKSLPEAQAVATANPGDPNNWGAILVAWDNDGRHVYQS